MQNTNSTKMAKTLNMLPSNDPYRKILQMGYFNASKSAALTRTCFKGDSFGEYENNENGDLFLQYCVEEKLQIIQTFFEHKWSHRVTWESNDKVTEKVIDYALSGEWIRRHTIDARTRPGYAIDSDHVMLVLRMRTPRFRRDRKEHCPKPSAKTTRVDLSKLKDPQRLKMFMRATEEALNATTNPTMEEIDRILSLTTHQELEPSKKPRKQSYPWDTDEELNTLLHQRKNAPSYDPTERKRLTRKIRQRVQKLKGEEMVQVGKKLKLLHETRQIQRLFKEGKQDYLVKTKPSTKTKCQTQRPFLNTLYS